MLPKLAIARALVSYNAKKASFGFYFPVGVVFVAVLHLLDLFYE